MGAEKLEHMVAVPVERFFSGLRSEVDVFVQLSDSKYVLITKAGEAFDIVQLQRYQVKNISHLFIRNQDYFVFLNKQVSIAGIALANKDFSTEKKGKVVSKVAESVYQALFEIGLDEQGFHSAKEVSQQVIELVEANSSLSNLMESLGLSSEEALQHAVAVSFVAPMIGKKLKWTRKETLEKLSLGGLLHDIGKKELSPELLAKPRSDWTFDEVKEYETHPYRGMVILSSIKGIPEDIVAIAYQHHENAMGQGFPRRLWDAKIHPLARVVSIANIFCNLTLKSNLNPIPMSAHSALDYIEKTMGQPFNRDVFRALEELVLDK